MDMKDFVKKRPALKKLLVIGTILASIGFFLAVIKMIVVIIDIISFMFSFGG